MARGDRLQKVDFKATHVDVVVVVNFLDGGEESVVLTLEEIGGGGLKTAALDLALSRRGIGVV